MTKEEADRILEETSQDIGVDIEQVRAVAGRVLEESSQDSDAHEEDAVFLARAAVGLIDMWEER